MMADFADLHLAILPGTDVALFHAMLHVMLWEKLVDERYIAAHPEVVPLTAAQRKELDRRKREHRRDPSQAKPWSEVHNRLEKRNK